MKLKDFRMGWRLLLKQPAYSGIMILGLTIGFAVCFLVLAFIHFETNVDSQVPALNEVYVLKARPNWGLSFWRENVPLSMKLTLEKKTGVQATAVLPYASSMRVGERVSDVELTLVDPSFPQVFGVSALEGDLQAVLSRPDALALTVETAQMLFGHPHAIGEHVQINGQSYQVAAILPKSAETSSIKLHALAGLTSSAWPASERARANDSWNYYADDDKGIVHCKVYARLGAGASASDLAQQIGADIETSALRGHLAAKDLADLGSHRLLDVAMGPLADSYLDTEARNNSGSKGDLIADYAMLAVTFLILLLTAGNYVNLATIRTIRRQREMAIRKVLGVSAARLVGQMMAESVLVSVLAAVLGGVLAWALLPALSDLTEHNLGAILGTRELLGLGAIALLMALLVGVGAGAYPAWTALKMRSIDALGGRDNSETAGGLWLRRVLTVVQFGIAMFVTGMIITISWQIGYLKHINYGYQVDSLLTISLPSDVAASEADSLRDALARLPEVKGVSGSTQWGVDVSYKTLKAESIVLNTLPVGPEYFATIGLGAAAGRVFDAAIDPRENAQLIVMNARAAQRLGYASAQAAVGQLVDMNGRPMRIAGISNDVSNGFMEGPPRAIVYQIGAALPELTVNGGSDLAAAQTAIEAVWRQHFPDHFLNLHRLRVRLEQNAGGPQEILTTATIAAVIIIPLAIFSIYILSAYAVQRRGREIVMRKLYGAGRRDIARLLMREFVALLGVAAVLGLPLAYVVGRMFVEQFADQAPIGGWAALAALFGAIVITLAATGRHIAIASRMSPVLALRAS
jgi:putative ABC transport system permease protein